VAFTIPGVGAAQSQAEPAMTGAAAGDDVVAPRHLHLRGRTSTLQGVFGWLCGLGFAAGALGYPFSTDGADPWWEVAGWSLLLVAFSLFFFRIGVRGPRRGIDADYNGVLITNMFSRRRFPWSHVDDIDLEAVKNEAGGVSYHRLVFVCDGERYVAEAPGGSDHPNSELVKARRRLLTMRDAARAR
jgi:hypothetical protein